MADISSYSHSRQPELVGLTVALALVTALMVATRFASRRFAGVEYWWDDWFALLSLVPVEGVNAFVLAEVSRGYGKHSSDPLVEVEFLKLTYFDEVIAYNPSLALIKVSILLFFLRVFPTKAIRWGAWSLLAIVAAWEVATEISLIFQCTPVEKAWNKAIERGHCVNTYAFFIGQAMPNIVTDFLILILPLRSIWKLQMPVSQRVVICGVFCLGIFVIACSIARLVTFIHLVFFDLTSESNTWWLI